VGEDVCGSVGRAGRRGMRVAGAVVVAAMVMTTVVGCGLLPGLPGSSAAPAGGGGASGGGAAGAEDAGRVEGGPGSSPTEPVPLGQKITIKTGVKADFAWEITVTGTDAKSYTKFSFTEDEPCFAVFGTATLVKVPDGESGASGLLDTPGIFLVDEKGQSLDPEPCVTEKDNGYKSALELDASTGETVKFVDTYALDGPTTGAALRLQDSISLADGGGVDDVYAAIR
jgi:hypothetical protein